MKVQTIVEVPGQGVLGIDQRNRLYWNGHRATVKLSFSRWIYAAAILTGVGAFGSFLLLFYQSFMAEHLMIAL
jgi:hypothetical protein